MTLYLASRCYLLCIWRGISSSSKAIIGYLSSLFHVEMNIEYAMYRKVEECKKKKSNIIPGSGKWPISSAMYRHFRFIDFAHREKFTSNDDLIAISRVLLWLNLNFCLSSPPLAARWRIKSGMTSCCNDQFSFPPHFVWQIHMMVAWETICVASR